MSFVWALSAMPMMVSAFIMTNLCESNSTQKNCTQINGTIVDDVLFFINLFYNKYKNFSLD